MKHIKEYNISKVEELSEYLQEFFDRFNIKEGKGDEPEDHPEIYWECNINNSLKIRDSLVIRFKDPYESFKIYDHLIGIKDMLERRCGCLL